MAENSKVRAPYNFVPFSNKVLWRYESAEELPRHDRLDSTLKSGEIHVTMTADTPVFVSDGQKGDLNFYRTPKGDYALPGSTIRGMVRENMQILGVGCVRPGVDFADVQIFYREIAAATGSTGDVLKQHYRDVMGLKIVRTNNKSVSVPQNVRAGYFRRDGNGCYIQPVAGKYLRVSRKHADLEAYANTCARVLPVNYTVRGDRVDRIQPGDAPVPGMEQGKLLFTGKSVGKPNGLYLFPGANEDADPVAISRQDLLSYQEDWENRRNVLKAYGEQFWALPEEGEEKPVFYIPTDDGHVYFGMSLFLRIGHSHALSEGLPEAYRQAEQMETLDYPNAILGFAAPDRSYRSRVSFEDFPVTAPVSSNASYGAVLGQPKPSYYPGYVSGGKNYSDEEFSLRGYKQYWLKEVGEIPAGKANVTTTLRPLPAGTRFSGVIHFKNLHEDELGLLLWCLRLEEGCYQSVGMGKPYGFGRMKLRIDRLAVTDVGSLYSADGLCGAVGADQTGDVGRYIGIYDGYAMSRLYVKRPKKMTSIRDRREIRDFLYLRSHVMPEEEASYMALDEYRNVRTPLPTIEEYREEKVEQKKQQTVDSSELTWEEQKAMLAARFNRH